MRMRANHKIDSAINEPAREFALFLSNLFAVFNTPMDQANDKICARRAYADTNANGDAYSYTKAFAHTELRPTPRPRP